MALYIKGIHILYYEMDAFRSFMIGLSYFISADYSITQGWIRGMLLSPTNSVLEWSNIYQYFKFFPEMVRQFCLGSIVLLYHQIVAVMS